MANIWLAAGEGKLDLVKQYVEQEGVSPNQLDDNAYSPLHAAASWNHPEILSYLVEHGGDINITDDDGETPLFVVETVAIARLVVQLGGNPSHRNHDGMTVSPFSLSPFSKGTRSLVAHRGVRGRRRNNCEKSTPTSPST